MRVDARIRRSLLVFGAISPVLHSVRPIVAHVRAFFDTCDCFTARWNSAASVAGGYSPYQAVPSKREQRVCTLDAP